MVYEHMEISICKPLYHVYPEQEVYTSNVPPLQISALLDIVIAFQKYITCNYQTVSIEGL